MISPQHSDVDHGVVKQGVLTATLCAIAVGLVGWGFEEAKRLINERRERAKAKKETS